MKKIFQIQTIVSRNKFPLIFASGVLLSVIVASLGTYFWQRSVLKEKEQSFQQQNNMLRDLYYQLRDENTHLENQGYYLVNSKCTSKECLFKIGDSNYLLGTAVVRGYYSPVERNAWGEAKICDGFTITDGSKEMIRAMVKLVDSGNTVHSKNYLNEPVINLELESLSQSEKNAIFKSSSENQIELLVFEDSPRQSGVGVCYRDVIVIKVI